MSPGPDTVIQSAMDRRNLPALFAALPLLKQLGPDTINELANEIEWFSLPGSATLYSAGQPVDGLYVIVNGAFSIQVGRPGQRSASIGTLSGGQLAGQMEVISGKPRSTTLVALRDSEVARLSCATFEKLARLHPQTLRYVATTLAERIDVLQQPQQRPTVLPKTFAVLPHDLHAPAQQFAADLVSALGRFGRCQLISSAQAAERTTHWFHRLERANDYVVYLAEATPSSWTRLCLRQADRQLLLASAGSRPHSWAALECAEGCACNARTLEVFLLHSTLERARPAAVWLEAQPCHRLHHLRDSRDIERAARLLTGRGVGLVLSGGGARGFAHIGVMRALREARIPVDSIGATSIGAVIGGGWAAGWDYEEMVERMRYSFVKHNPLSDYTLPFVSLVAGRKVCRLLREAYGETEIEDLRLPFYCASASLTSGALAVHRRGRLWLWVRASLGIPGVLPPVFAGRQAYVDGAALNNLPVDIMREEHAGPIIAVDVGAERGFDSDLEMSELPPLWSIRRLLGPRERRVNIMQILLRSGMLNSAANSGSQRELADVLLKPPLEKIDLLDWSAFEQTIELGYQHAMKVLETQAPKLLAAQPQAVSAAAGSSA
jgi:NTE family protein